MGKILKWIYQFDILLILFISFLNLWFYYQDIQVVRYFVHLLNKIKDKVYAI